MKKIKNFILILITAFTWMGFAQVTKSGISGTVKSQNGEYLPSATVEAIHKPTGTKYYATTDDKGRYSIPAVRPGGPYVVIASFVGFKNSEVIDVNAPLGNTISVYLILAEQSNTLQEIVIKSSPNTIFSKNRTGASQQFSSRELNAIPINGSRTITNITKYNANSGRNGSFGGQDARLNNFTIDGSVFNNGFGLGNSGAAGGRTGSTAISLDAIEQLQVNIAPYDVRQSGFLGSGINAVTKSGTNDIEGSAYTSLRNNSKNFVGTKAGEKEIVPSKFEERIIGARVGLPIFKNKLFFFGNFEAVNNVSPATTWTATGSSNPSGQVARTTTEDLQKVSDLLQRSYGYSTGPWENFDANAISKKYLARFDWNIDKRNILNLRYIHHDSSSDELVSNSSSAGAGNRRTNANSISYKNGGYTIQDNTRSIVLEIDSKFSNRINNNFIAGFDKQIEDRGLQGTIFPTIDILKDNATYISAGLDPFTEGNKLNYSTLHFTNNLTLTAGKHTMLFGANFDYFKAENQFIIASNGSFVFRSLADFENAVAESVQLNGAQTVTNLPSQVQLNYPVVPNILQVFKANKLDVYAQDNFKVYDNLNLTFGLRATRVWFADTGFANKFLTGFIDKDGNTVAPLTFANGQQFDSAKMPDAQLLFEPRIGFNLDVFNDKTTQVRGGSGIFTGRPPYVLLTNALGNSGAIINGFRDTNNTTRGFTINPVGTFTPQNLEPSPRFQLNATDTNYKFPQVWKSSLGIDQKLPFGFFGTLEGIFGQNINAATYFDANLDKPVGVFSGTDSRSRFANNDNGVRIQDGIAGAYVLTNKNNGYFYSGTFKLEYPYKKGLWGSIAYTHSKAYDLNSVGSTAGSAYNRTATVNGNNELTLSLSDNNTPNRIVGLLGYKLEYGKKSGGATSFNLGYIGEQTEAFSYTINGDLNGDRIRGNDLIYVPKSASELRFDPLTVSYKVNNITTTTIFTEEQQRTAFDAYINQDEYLSTRRGNYAERNGATLPMLHRLDFSVTQDIYFKSGTKKNSLQIRADILNFANLLNSDWGISKRVTNTNLLSFSRYDATANTPVYRLASQTLNDNSVVLIKDTYQANASVRDVWQAQLTLRYTFGK